MLDPHIDPSRGVNSGGEPAYCPSCELRHTRRPDWLCPRCRMPVEADVPPPRARRVQPYEKKFPPGSRIAGAILAVAGAALASAFARHPVLEHRWRLAAVVVLAVLGLALLLKAAIARWAAISAAVVAAVLASEGLIRERLPDLLPRDPMPGLMRQPLRDLVRDLQPARIFLVLGFAVACVLLIAGRPRRVRIAAGVLLAAPLIFVEILRAFGR